MKFYRKKIEKILFPSLVFSLFLSLFFALCQSVDASFLRDINDGIELFNKGHFKSAQSFFENYIKSNPDDEDGYFYLAKTYQKISESDLTLTSRQANKEFIKAWELILKKRNVERVFFDADKKSFLDDYFDMAQTYFETGNYDKASRYADLMLKINPKSALAYFIKAKVEYTKGENSKALNYLNYAILYNNEIIKTNLAQMLEINKIPEINPEVCYYKAIEAFFEGDLDGVKKYLKKFVELDCENVEMANFLADFAFKTNDINLAQEINQNISKQTLSNVQNLVNQAKILKIKNEQEKIEPVLLKAYKINPNNKELLFEFANYYLDKKDYNNSKKYFENLISIDDDFYEAYFGYIYSLIQLKDFDNAIKIIRKASKINPKTGEIPYLLAQICILNAQYKEAAGYLKDAMKLEDNPLYCFELMKLNYFLGDYSSSVENVKTLLNSNYSLNFNSEIYEYLARNLIKTKDFKMLQSLINTKDRLDKNKIIYKYILYKFYKLNNTKSNEKVITSYLSQLKKAKPITEADFIDLSEFYFDEYGLNSSVKLINDGIKKFPQSTLLYSQKLKLYYLAGEKEKIKELISAEKFKINK